MCRFWRKERENGARFFCGDVEKLVARIDAPSGQKRMDGALAREGVCDLHRACDDVRVRWTPCVTGIRLIEALCGASSRRSYFDEARHRWRFECVNPSGHGFVLKQLFSVSCKYIFFSRGVDPRIRKKNKTLFFEFSFHFFEKDKRASAPKKKQKTNRAPRTQAAIGAVGLKKVKEKKK